MADGDETDVETEDVPFAAEAFSSSGAERDQAAFRVARAGALLTLVRPQGVESGVFRAVTAEARETLRARSVEVETAGSRELNEALADLGEVGDRALRIADNLPETTAGDAEKLHVRTDADLGSKAYSFAMSQLHGHSPSEQERVIEVQGAAAAALFDGYEPPDSRGLNRAAQDLVAAALLDTDPLTQVAAAGAALRLERRHPIAEAVLGHGEKSGSEDVALLSRAILSQDRRSDTRRVELESRRLKPGNFSDSALIHGTWARRGKWWRPSGDLHRYISTEESLFPNLYSGDSRFEWSGYYSFRNWGGSRRDWHRRQAADSLAWWSERQLCAQPDLIGHSYGGALSLLATRAEKEVRGLVMLSPAVHIGCLPDARYYDQILHVRSRLDLVLLADIARPALLSALPRVTDWNIKRRGLLGHGVTHKPSAWKADGLTRHLREEWLPGLPGR